MKDIAHHLRHQQRKILRDARHEKASRMEKPAYEEAQEKKLNPNLRRIGKRDWV